MNGLHETIRLRAAALLSRAQDDLFVVEGMLRAENSPAWVIAFHAQQAAEKAIKALLTYDQIDFPFTHDIRLLLDQIDRRTEWRERLEPACNLTGFAATVRYVIGKRDITRPEAESAARVAKIVVNEVMNTLASEGFEA